jgi:hypothetical protein
MFNWFYEDSDQKLNTIYRKHVRCRKGNTFTRYLCYLNTVLKIIWYIWITKYLYFLIYARTFGNSFDWVTIRRATSKQLVSLDFMLYNLSSLFPSLEHNKFKLVWHATLFLQITKPEVMYTDSILWMWTAGDPRSRTETNIPTLQYDTLEDMNNIVSLHQDMFLCILPSLGYGVCGQLIPNLLICSSLPRW